MQLAHVLINRHTVTPDTMNRRLQQNETTDDETLMSLFRDGDHTAFEVLYRRHKGPLYRYFLRQCAASAIAEELYQDVWLSLVKARERYEPTAKFTTYLYKCAHHKLIDFYRRNKATDVTLSSYEDDPDDEPAVVKVADIPAREPENEINRKRQHERLMDLIGQLPEAQREAFLLRQEGGLSIEEIAATIMQEAGIARQGY